MYGISYNECELAQYCVQKYGLAKAILYLCYISAQKPIESAYHCIIKSHDCYAAARQLIDEIKDYSEDFKNNKFNVYANEPVLKYGTIADEEVIKKQLSKKAFCKLHQAIDYVKRTSSFWMETFFNILKGCVVSTMEDIIIAVDLEDRPIKPVSKTDTHAKSILHRAFSVVLFNDQKILMQKRALSKYHCGGLWSNTCCSHPIWEEPLLSAVYRKLEHELGITSADVRKIGHINYFCQFDNGLSEFEYDHIFIGQIGQRK